MIIDLDGTDPYAFDVTILHLYIKLRAAEFKYLVDEGVITDPEHIETVECMLKGAALGPEDTPGSLSDAIFDRYAAAHKGFKDISILNANNHLADIYKKEDHKDDK